ncbi:MAG: hypothetical protein HRU32_04100 [Rhodobacteraceae bacterium]|nr:hypothetical protein [Paracoccaceae bacterium]
MGLKPPNGLTGIIDRRARRRWASAARLAPQADIPSLRSVRAEARRLKRHLDDVLHVAEGRLALPLIEADAIKAPLHSDWAFRPDPWAGPLAAPGQANVPSGATFGSDLTVFHDCPLAELSVRQIRNNAEDDLAPFSLRMDVFRFEGSFLSAVIDLPSAAVSDLKRRHMIRLEAWIETERPIEIFARLNVRHGPNTEQIVREFGRIDAVEVIEFDLAYTDITESKVERMWLDLIFEDPEMNQITLRDLTLSRRPRAEL